MPTLSSTRSRDHLDLGVPFFEYPPVSVGMIGSRILPTLSVSKKTAEFPAITRERWLERRDVRRQGASTFARDTYGVEMITYDCLGYGFESPVTKAERELWRSEFDADNIAQSLVGRVLEAEKEIRIAAQIFDGTTNWPSGTSELYTDVTTDWDQAAATIISDVEGAKEHVRANSGMEANTIVFSHRHIQSLRINTELKTFYFQGTPVLTASLLFASLPALFGIPNVLIGSGIYNSGSEGADLSITDIWADTYAWIGVVPMGGPETPGVGRTMQWDAFSPDGFEWNRYTEPQTKTDIWQAEHWTHEKVIDPYFAHLLKIDT